MDKKRIKSILLVVSYLMIILLVNEFNFAKNIRTILLFIFLLADTILLELGFKNLHTDDKPKNEN